MSNLQLSSLFLIIWICTIFLSLSAGSALERSQISSGTQVDYSQEELRYEAKVDHDLRKRYINNDVMDRYQVCRGGYTSYNDSYYSEEECMQVYGFVKHEEHPRPSAMEYFSELDWDIWTRCNQSTGIDSSLCPIILGN